MKAFDEDYTPVEVRCPQVVQWEPIHTFNPLARLWQAEELTEQDRDIKEKHMNTPLTTISISYPWLLDHIKSGHCKKTIDIIADGKSRKACTSCIDAWC